MIGRLLERFAAWALSKNPPGAYQGEDDPRWAYTIEVDGKPYLTRVLSPSLFGCRLYLHHFHRPDAGRWPHNHPWRWAASLVLSGSYDEERVGLGVRRIRWFNRLTSRDYHDVKALHGDVWTLFLVGPPTGKDWGFLVNGVHVPWREHLGK